MDQELFNPQPSSTVFRDYAKIKEATGAVYDKKTSTDIVMRLKMINEFIDWRR